MQRNVRNVAGKRFISLQRYVQIENADLVGSVNMITCKECKWWDGPCSPNSGYGNRGHCDHAMIWGEMIDRVDESDHQDSYSGGVSVYAGLRTGPDFGCIHGERKE